jgi:CHASE2 domain-containing sensor protein
MANVLNIIQKQKPKVVGIDAFYRKLKGENGQANGADSSLADAFKNTKNLVMVSKLEGYNDKKKQFDTITQINHFFGQHTQHAYANLTTTGEGNMQDFLTCRSFMPQAKAKGKQEIAFAVKLAQLFDAQKAKKFLARNNVSEYINYKRSVEIQTGNSSKKNQEIGYVVLDHLQLLADEVAADALKDKIVLIGYMGETIFEKSFDDKFYTPLNQNYVGKSTPDMFGVVVHANIISMILAEDYIDEMNDFTL